MSDIDRIVDYVAGLDPGFPTAIKGAAQTQVDELERIVNRPLPSLYRDFLLRMGRGMDWINVRSARLDIDTVLAYYRRPGWSVPHDALRIGQGTIEGAHDLYLLDGHVVSFPRPDFGEDADPSEIAPIAGSLTELIGARAFREVRIKRNPYGLRLFQPYSRDDPPAAVDPVLAPLGFAPAWFSTDWTLVLESRQAALVATKGPNSSLVVDCSAVKDDLLRETATVLMKTLGLQELHVKDIWRQG